MPNTPEPLTDAELAELRHQLTDQLTDYRWSAVEPPHRLLATLDAATAERDALQARVAELEAEQRWRCYHCGEVFTNAKYAAEHFGADEGATPACRLTYSEGHLVTYIRKLEKELAVHRREDSDVLRAMHAREAEQAEKVRRAEERGYNRGVQEAKVMFETEIAERDRLQTRVAELEAELQKRAGFRGGFTNRELMQMHRDMIANPDIPPANPEE